MVSSKAWRTIGKIGRPSLEGARFREDRSDPDEYENKNVLKPFMALIPWELCDGLKIAVLAIYAFWSSYDQNPSPVRALRSGLRRIDFAVLSVSCAPEYETQRTHRRPALEVREPEPEDGDDGTIDHDPTKQLALIFMKPLNLILNQLGTRLRRRECRSLTCGKRLRVRLERS
jgi:hypothetical protein